MRHAGHSARSRLAVLAHIERGHVEVGHRHAEVVADRDLNGHLGIGRRVSAINAQGDWLLSRDREGSEREEYEEGKR